MASRPFVGVLAARSHGHKRANPAPTLGVVKYKSTEGGVRVQANDGADRWVQRGRPWPLRCDVRVYVEDEPRMTEAFLGVQGAARDLEELLALLNGTREIMAARFAEGRGRGMSNGAVGDDYDADDATPLDAPEDWHGGDARKLSPFVDDLRNDHELADQVFSGKDEAFAKGYELGIEEGRKQQNE